MSYGRYGGWAPYVSVAARQRQAEKTLADLVKKGERISPVVIEGRKIATTFWGKAWCDNLEAYSDFENRLPRGRAYVRNGSVLDLQITEGQIVARVSGSFLYTVEVKIKSLPSERWKAITRECAGGIDSLVELLSGKLSRAVMEIITRKGAGLFPAPDEISMQCSCPDFATLCKHVAATLYGIGARLDHEPHLLFLLRNVDQGDLIQQAETGIRVAPPGSATAGLDEDSLSALFGIDLAAPTQRDAGVASAPHPPTKKKAKTKVVASKKQPSKTSKNKPDVTPTRKTPLKKSTPLAATPKNKPTKKPKSVAQIAPSKKAPLKKVKTADLKANSKSKPAKASKGTAGVAPSPKASRKTKAPLKKKAKPGKGSV